MNDEKQAVTRVAVVGLGAMGLPIAERLAERFSVVGIDLAEPRLELARAAGLEVARDATQLVGGAQAVVLTVRDASQLGAVLFGDHGIAASLSPGSVVLCCATVGIEAARDIGARLAETGAHLIDAPMSGGAARARTGDLLLVVGASETALATGRPVLDAMASTVSVVGNEPGDGQALKTVNQLLCGVHIAAAAEALALAQKLGLDPEAALNALTSGAASSFMLENRGPRVIDGLRDKHVDVLSSVSIFTKDMGIVGDAARRHHLPTPVAGAAESLFLLAAAAGHGDADDSQVVRILSSTNPREG